MCPPQTARWDRHTELASEFTSLISTLHRHHGKLPIIVDVFTASLLRNGLHNTVLLLLRADDIETQPSLLLRNLGTDCLSRICFRGNSFTNTLPSNGRTCNIVKEISDYNSMPAL
jgi:hypothetical protein